MDEKEKMTETNTENKEVDKEVKSTEKVEENSELFDKLDSIIAKRVDGLAKSILRDNGVEDADIKDILSKYKENKDSKTKSDFELVEKLKKENTELKNKVLDGKISGAAIKIAENLNIDVKYMPQVMKLADLSSVAENGELDENKLSEAIAKVIDDAPVFKKTTTEETSGFVNLGGNSSEDKPEDGVAKLRQAMGLK